MHITIIIRFLFTSVGRTHIHPHTCSPIRVENEEPLSRLARLVSTRGVCRLKNCALLASCTAHKGLFSRALLCRHSTFCTYPRPGRDSSNLCLCRFYDRAFRSPARGLAGAKRKGLGRRKEGSEREWERPVLQILPRCRIFSYILARLSYFSCQGIKALPPDKNEGDKIYMRADLYGNYGANLNFRYRIILHWGSCTECSEF